MNTLETTLHAYSFDISKPKDAAAYQELCAKLTNGPHQMHAIGDFYKTGIALDGCTITLELAHLFDNQWNTAPLAGHDKGLRVFDWAEEAIFNDRGRENKTIKRGHYLDQTDAMREVRRNTLKCGYCGHQERAERGSVFCSQCIDSEYLKESDLHMLRMVPIDQSGVGREFPPLTEAERAHLLPLYKEAQLHGSTERGKARKTKQRADLEAKFKRETQSAKDEHDGLLWLLDRGFAIDNVIYYSHTRRFGFGWRHPVEPAIKSELLDVLSEFPFEYDIK